MAYALNTDVYRISGITTTQMSTTDVDELILQAQAFVDRLANTTFESNSITQTLDGNGGNTIFLDHWPLIAVSALAIDGTTVTVPTQIYSYINEGKIRLKDTAEETIFKDTLPQQVVLTYTYGYDYDFVTKSNNPDAYIITKITSIIAAINALINQIGGTFDDVTSYSMPELTASKGEPFTNIRETIMRLNNDYIRMVESKEWKVFTKHIFFA